MNKRLNLIKNWESLEIECRKCQKCSLYETRTNLVFGEGNLKSKILFVGEGPGYNEDVQGRPFVGRSGKLLDTLLEEINFLALLYSEMTKQQLSYFPKTILDVRYIHAGIKFH